MKFKIIAYATLGGYEQESRRLKAALDWLKMSYHIKIMSSLGSWQKNCLHKPVFIQEMLKRYQQPVLYLDVDAMIYHYPALIDSLDADFAVHYFRGKQLASGTLFFNYTPAAFRLLNLWILQNAAFQKESDQNNLQHVLEKYFQSGDDWLKTVNLPEEYCKIFDLAERVKEPVIEHFPASRRLRTC